MPPSPERLAATLAQIPTSPATEASGATAATGDARVDLHRLWWEVEHAVAHRGTPAARARLATVSRAELRAGTVQDGVARGAAVTLEEAWSLCAPPPARAGADVADVAETTGKALRKRREVLVAAAGTRVRFSRKMGLLLVDREHDVSVPDCVAFEDRADQGTLDGFEPVPGERARLFSPAFLQPVRLLEASAWTRLELGGRLGRGPAGFPCRLAIEGRTDRPRVSLAIAIRNDHDDHRLRIRLRGLPETAAIGHRGTPGWEWIEHHGRRFLAATLVRACGRLTVGDGVVATPLAQCRGWIEHVFALGGGDDPEPPDPAPPLGDPPAAMVLGPQRFERAARGIGRPGP